MFEPQSQPGGGASTSTVSMPATGISRSRSDVQHNNCDDFIFPSNLEGIDGGQVNLQRGTLYLGYVCKYCTNTTILVRANPPKMSHSKEKGTKFSQHCRGAQHQQQKAAIIDGHATDKSVCNVAVIPPNKFFPDKAHHMQWTTVNVTDYLFREQESSLKLHGIKDFHIEYEHPPTADLRFAVQAVPHPQRTLPDKLVTQGSLLKQMYVCVFKKSETEVLVSLDRDTVEKHFREQLCDYESTLFSMDLAWKIPNWAPKEVMRQIYLDWGCPQLKEPRLKQYLSLVGTVVYAPEGGIRDKNGILSPRNQDQLEFEFRNPATNDIRRVVLPEECKYLFDATGSGLPFAQPQVGLPFSSFKRIQRQRTT